MSWFSTVDPRRFNDRRVRRLSTVARLLWRDLLAGESATRVPGLARGGPAALGEQIGESAGVVERALGEMQTAGAVEADLGERIIRLVDVAVDWERAARSAQTVQHWLTLARDLPRSEVVVRALAELAAVCPAELPIRGDRPPLRAAVEWRRLMSVLAPASPLGPAALAAPPSPPAAEEDPQDMSARTWSEHPTPPSVPPRPCRLDGPAEAPPRPLPGASEAPLMPPGSGSGSRDVGRGGSGSGSRSKISDHPPSPPAGGDGAVEAAVRVLREGARSMNTAGPDAATAAELRAVRRLRGREDDVDALLPVLAARQVERVRRDLTAGRDYRDRLTVADVVREWSRLRGASHLDAGARASPTPAAPAMFRAAPDPQELPT